MERTFLSNRSSGPGVAGQGIRDSQFKIRETRAEISGNRSPAF